MGSGLASMRPDSADVKCLHAQVGDELVRGGNKIASQVLRDLEDQGIPIDGTDECCDNCNVCVPLEQARWRLDKCKNTAGKRLGRQRKEAAAIHGHTNTAHKTEPDSEPAAITSANPV